MVDVRIDNPFRRRAVLKLKIFNVQIIVLAKHIIFSNREVSSLHPFSKLRVLSEKYSYFKCQFYVTKTAKNSKRKQTVKRHFKPYFNTKTERK